MSLDVYLKSENPMPQLCEHCGSTYYKTEEYFHKNITHNLNKMAEACGIYYHLWRPDEIGIKYAKELIEPIHNAISLMRGNRQYFEQFNSPNGWGKYEHFLPFLESYLYACKQYPDSIIIVSEMKEDILKTKMSEATPDVGIEPILEAMEDYGQVKYMEGYNQALKDMLLQITKWKEA